MLMIIVFIETGERRILINYIKMNMKGFSYEKTKTYLPIKLNFAGVIPPIFASTLLAFPSSLLSILHAPHFTNILKYFNQENCIYQFFFSIFIIFFSYFYTTLQLNTEIIAKNMVKSNSFILNIRPGKQTSQYITFIINKVIIWGSLYLIALCMFPIVFQEFISSNISLYFGGTGLIIITTAAMDILNQIENILIVKKYSSYNFFFNIHKII